jgi:peptidyl-dipeptidase Dcp
MLDLLLNPATPYASIPFNQLEPQKFEASFDEAFAIARQRIQQIESEQNPNFTNIIEAMELASLELDHISSIFFNLYHACTNEHLDQMVGPISEKLAEFSNDIQLSPQLFKQVREVYQQKDQLSLNREQIKLLQDTFEGFTRNGALLDDEDKQKLRELDKQLASLSPQYSQNLLKATNAYRINIDDEKLVAALPSSVKAAAREEAQQKGEAGWTFTLQAPSYIPFMKYMPERSLREQMWKAYNSKALVGEFSNRELCGQIARLRFQRAQLLGFKNHADFVLQKRMAKSPERVGQFLDELKQPSLTAARRDIDELKAFISTILQENVVLMPWDFAYYSEKMKKHAYDIDDEELRPYFPVDKVVEGVFLHGKKLYDLDFNLSSKVPVYNDDVDVFEVTRQGEFIGLLYIDLYPRENKKSGAWMTNYVDQGFDGKEVRRPHVSIVCNFTRPVGDQPSLLTFNEVQTLFHEFGHALHSLCSHCHYRSLAGTHVLWDFVELPSQIMENWTYEPESLSLFARHYQTGEVIPQKLIDKLNKARLFQEGYASLRQISFSLVDLKWHQDIEKQNLDPVALEDEVLGEVQLLPRIEGTNFSVGFSHIFAGGYSAGYYSYKWAEVLDADAFEAFKEAGIFNPQVANQFYREILSRGGVEDPGQLFKNFRGREPDSQALLRRSGFIE